MNHTRSFRIICGFFQLFLHANNPCFSSVSVFFNAALAAEQRNSLNLLWPLFGPTGGPDLSPWGYG